MLLQVDSVWRGLLGGMSILVHEYEYTHTHGYENIRETAEVG